MASESRTTTDHETIRKWAESRGGKPTSVRGTEKGGEPGVLRLDFPGYSGGDRLEEITWDEFFKKFDENNLAFLYQEHTSSGEESRFFKLVNRDSAEHKAASKSHSHEAEDTHAHKASHKSEEKSHKAEAREDDKAHTHKANEKEHAHKAEHKTEDKTHKADEKEHAHKAEHKSDDKAHKAEHKSDEKSHKAEHKTDEKGHKSEHAHK